MRTVGVARALPVALRGGIASAFGTAGGAGKDTGAPGAADNALGIPAEAMPAAPSSIFAMTVSTGTTSPSAASSLAMRPLAGAGRSLSALSVAIETIGWSLVTASPSRTSHFAMVPSLTLSPSWGRVTSISMDRLISEGPSICGPGV